MKDCKVIHQGEGFKIFDDYPAVIELEWHRTEGMEQVHIGLCFAEMRRLKLKEVRIKINFSLYEILTL